MTESKRFFLRIEAEKILNNACKHRDRLYRHEYKEWKKLMRMFERPQPCSSRAETTVSFTS